MRVTHFVFLTPYAQVTNATLRQSTANERYVKTDVRYTCSERHLTFRRNIDTRRQWSIGNIGWNAWLSWKMIINDHCHGSVDKNRPTSAVQSLLSALITITMCLHLCTCFRMLMAPHVTKANEVSNKIRLKIVLLRSVWWNLPWWILFQILQWNLPWWMLFQILKCFFFQLTPLGVVSGYV